MNVVDSAWGVALALAIGFLVGRTREQPDNTVPKPGIRDFMVIALLGAVAALVMMEGLTLTLLGGVVVFLLVMRYQHPLRKGITTELAAMAVFVLGYCCLTPFRPFGAALGILLAFLLLVKDELHAFALKTISGKEFDGTLKFLALIFVIYPLLPEGSYGPFDFFEPRKIWIFVILVSGVSFFGYFLTKFLDAKKGVLLTAVVGGIASTTAYTGGISRVVRESPETARSLVRATLLANSVMFPRMALLLLAISPGLLNEAAKVLAAMTVAGLLAAWFLGKVGSGAKAKEASSGFTNPFSWGPLLRFGLIFVAVLFLAKAGSFYLGSGGQKITALVGGLMDVDAVLLSAADFFNAGQSSGGDAVLVMLLAISANAFFKSGLAISSGTKAFYLRVVVGFVVMIMTGFVVWWIGF